MYEPEGDPGGEEKGEPMIIEEPRFQELKQQVRDLCDVLRGVGLRVEALERQRHITEHGDVVYKFDPLTGHDHDGKNADPLIVPAARFRVVPDSSLDICALYEDGNALFYVPSAARDRLARICVILNHAVCEPRKP